MPERPIFGKSYSGKEFQPRRSIHGLNIFEVNIDMIGDIAGLAGSDYTLTSFLVDIGKPPYKVTIDTVTYSLGANPCAIAAVFKEDDIYLMHSWGLDFTQEQRDILRQAEAGLAGGEIGILNTYQSLFISRKIRIIRPKSSIQDAFSIAVVRRDITPDDPRFRIPPGIYYSYDNEDRVRRKKRSPLIEV